MRAQNLGSGLLGKQNYSCSVLEGPTAWVLVYNYFDLCQSLTQHLAA